MSTISFPKKEEEILAFWEKHKIFKKSLEKPSPRGNFVFYEGPPTANGKPALHHVLARAFKDVIPRFKTRLYDAVAGIHTVYRWNSKSKNNLGLPENKR